MKRKQEVINILKWIKKHLSEDYEEKDEDILDSMAMSMFEIFTFQNVRLNVRLTDYYLDMRRLTGLDSWLDETIRPGDRVRMTRAFKNRMGVTSSEHIAEFGKCIGEVIDLMDYSTDGIRTPSSVYKEWNVRWKPSGLQYVYSPEDLEKII